MDVSQPYGRPATFRNDGGPRGVRGNRGFDVRAMEPRDAARIAALFSEVFGRSMSPAEVRWKLFDTPATTTAPPSFVAVSGDRLVGQYAGTPTRFLVGGQVRVGLHGCDVMTAPDFRRRGVLTTLGTRAHQVWRSAGLVFVTGLASDAWGSRSSALAWVELFPFRWLVAPLAPEVVLARRLGVAPLARLTFLGVGWRALAKLRSRRDRSVSVEEVTGAGPAFDELWAACRDRLDLTVVRDRAWVEWRYFRAPGGAYRVLLARRRGRPVGYVAFTVREEGRGIVAELFAAPSDEGALSELLRDARGRMRAAGAEVASALAVPGSPVWRACRRAGFLRGAEYAFEVVRLDGDVALEDLGDRRRWTLAGGDFDVV